MPDVWTNYQHEIAISYMLLERGHAPVAASDTDTYLSNPIANNKYLLAPDVNFDNAGINRSSRYVPFGNGIKYVCIASTCDQDSVSSLGEVVSDSSYSPSGTIRYSNESARYGYQLRVSGLSMGNGRDYSDANTPATVGTSIDGYIPNNLTVYAIPASEVYGARSTFFTDLIKKCPQFLTTVKACFVVDEACITLGSKEVTIAGHKLRRCVGKRSTLTSFNLSKSEFSYPAKLQRFAKLFTSPYAQIEITDNDGTTFAINIEETSTLSVKAVVSTAFPYINERIYIDGIGGIGSQSYSWVDLRDNPATLQMPNSDWFKYCFDWKIPTFALYMDGQTAFMLETFNRNVKQAIQQSLVNYHTAVRSANTAYENACDQADVAYANTERAANTARNNAYRSADTARTNAYNSAATMKTNADLQADTAYGNVDRSCTNETNNRILRNVLIIQNEEAAILAATDIKDHNNDLLEYQNTHTNAMVKVNTDASLEVATATTISAQAAGLMTSGLQGGASGAVIGASGGPYGALGGAAIGVVSGAIHAASAMVGLGATTNTSLAVQEAQIATNAQMTTHTKDNNDDNQSTMNDEKRIVYGNTCDYNTNTTSNNNATSRANAGDTRTTQKTVATNNKATQQTNADNTNYTSRANASDTYSTTASNADRTRDNVKANSGYTRQVAVLNAKEILENGKYAAMAAIEDAKNSAPVECCPYSGNPDADYMRTRGIQIKVKTQSDSAIWQTGSVFARFGYALNQIWDVAESGLTLMNHFTYWKASEIWVNGTDTANNSVTTFVRNMFLRGVTVWGNPDEIGAVDVFDN